LSETTAVSPTAPPVAARTAEIKDDLQQAALLRAETLQEAIFKSENISIIATDAKGVIQLFNVGAQRMLGYSADEVLNKITPAEIWDPQEIIARAQVLSSELGTTIRPGFEALSFKASRAIQDVFELTFIRKDLTRFPAMVSVTALRDSATSVIGYLLMGTDNTARKRVEDDQKKLDRRLRDQQFYTRSLIEANIDAIMTTDLLGVITDVNKQMEALTGCSRDELVGGRFNSHFTDPDRADAAIAAVVSEGKITNYELTAHTRAGKETVVSYNATTFYDREQKVQGVFASARDITERRALDRVLEEKSIELQSAKGAAEQANRSKSDFLSSMSHELRSPLNAILGFAQLMESETPPPTTVQSENIGQILQAGWHLLKLIDEILDLAKIESGKLSLSPESVSLSEVLDECQSMFDGQAQKLGIQVAFPTFEVPCYVLVDRTRLKQVLINLLSNAIKYNRVRGKVQVSWVTEANGQIRVNIADTGAGLSPERLAQLFQPFNRLGQETGLQQGTGIGLVVAKQLTELMGGVLGVKSTEGEGSTFWVDLIPAAEPQFSAGSDTDALRTLPPASRGPAQVVLYVEDNLANLRLIEQLIGRRPELHLLTAQTGGAGVMLTRTNRPDVILMDINLPDMSGIDAMRLLRCDPSAATIPIVAISANAMPHDIRRGMNAGFFRYITKPIKVAEFMETLDEALALARRAAPQPLYALS
jgi:PAS domain S-box-containing protein